MYFLSYIICYLIGNINSSYILTMIIKGFDIRKHGSKNPGATNTFRVVGKKAGVLVGICDALKGFVAVGVASNLSDNSILVMTLSALLVVIGHNWPMFLGFRGGKGIATTFGVACYLFFSKALICLFLAVIVLFLSRYVAIASLSFTVFLFLSTIVSSSTAHEYVILTLIFIIFAFVRHKENITNIRNNCEGEF